MLATLTITVPDLRACTYGCAPVLFCFCAGMCVHTYVCVYTCARACMSGMFLPTQFTSVADAAQSNMSTSKLINKFIMSTLK